MVEPDQHRRLQKLERVKTTNDLASSSKRPGGNWEKALVSGPASWEPRNSDTKNTGGLAQRALRRYRCVTQYGVQESRHTEQEGGSQIVAGAITIIYTRDFESVFSRLARANYGAYVFAFSLPSWG